MCFKHGALTPGKIYVHWLSRNARYLQECLIIIFQLFHKSRASVAAAEDQSVLSGQIRSMIFYTEVATMYDACFPT